MNLKKYFNVGTGEEFYQTRNMQMVSDFFVDRAKKMDGDGKDAPSQEVQDAQWDKLVEVGGAVLLGLGTVAAAVAAVALMDRVRD